jgi:AcrR family transcriptional regulator
MLQEGERWFIIRSCAPMPSATAAASSMRRVPSWPSTTLYRHHPTKADLIAAVVEDSVEAIATAAEAAVADLHAGGDAAQLLTSLFATVAEAHTLDRAVKEALHSLEQGASVTDPAAAPEGSATARAATAIEELLAAGRSAGTLRADLTVDDLVVLLAGVPDGEAPRRDRYVSLVTAAILAPR